MAITWPDLKMTKCDVHLRSMTKSGGRTVNGREQRIFNDPGYFDIAYEVSIQSDEDVRNFRWMMSELRSGEEVLARIADCDQPRGAYGVDVSASLTSTVAARATEIPITVTGAQIEKGMLIGIGVNRVHIVSGIISGGPADFYNHVISDNQWEDDLPWSDSGPTAKNYVVKIIPPMRAGFGGGTAVKFRGITMRGVLAEMSDGDLSLDIVRFGTVSFTIRESI